MINLILLLSILIGLISLPISSSADNEKSLYITSDNKYGRLTTDFDRVDDTRTFTSEALFIQSIDRLNRLLTEDELRSIIRARDRFQSFNNISVIGKEYSFISFFYKYRNNNDVQITNFFEPYKFNDVKLNEFGLDIGKLFNEGKNKWNFYLRGSYKYSEREGIIEFLPDINENINEYEFNANIMSPCDGTDAWLVYANYDYQDINPDIPNPPNRERQIGSLGFNYGTNPKCIGDSRYKILENLIRLQRVENITALRFDSRGLKLYGGLVYDKETYGDVDVTNNDYFIGTSLSGLFPNQFHNFDFSIRPTFFTHEVEGDSSQDNAQYRTDLALSYYVNDYLSFTVPWKHDIAIQGPDDYENWKIGVELKYNTNTNAKLRISTLIGYYFERFYNLDKNLDLFLLGLRFDY